ncbi:MAG TPA: hypothetical protein PKZ53_21850, partial [Acidobacteriota bacterium]|nr:hypothetical protein [Acidobacteriota bacterium]
AGRMPAFPGGNLFLKNYSQLSRQEVRLTFGNRGMTQDLNRQQTEPGQYQKTSMQQFVCQDREK